MIWIHSLSCVVQIESINQQVFISQALHLLFSQHRLNSHEKDSLFIRRI
jgi:hypothetical protein